MENRIDYLKLQYPTNDPVNVDRIKTRWENWWQLGGAEAENARSHMRWNNVYDGRGNWSLTLDISGPSAGVAIYALRAEEWELVTRIDKRVEIDVSLDKKATRQIYDNAQALNTMKRNIGQATAKPRAKTDKRDAGGERVYIGSLKSTKYLAVYTKPGEKTAVELKLSGAPLKQLIADVVRANKAIRSEDKLKVASDVSYQLYKMLDSHLEKTTGFGVSSFAVWADQEMNAERPSLNELRRNQVVSNFTDLPYPVQLSLLDELAVVTFGKP